MRKYGTSSGAILCLYDESVDKELDFTCSINPFNSHSLLLISTKFATHEVDTGQLYKLGKCNLQLNYLCLMLHLVC
jgi:hypothetical protein